MDYEGLKEFRIECAENSLEGLQVARESRIDNDILVGMIGSQSALLAGIYAELKFANDLAQKSARKEYIGRHLP
jgi:hypothetical protein